jgi:hypothetical protein
MGASAEQDGAHRAGANALSLGRPLASTRPVILHRRQHDPATRDYIARRVAEGKSTRDGILKRYLARHLYRVIQNSTPLTT